MLQSSFTLIILALGLIGAGAVTLIPKSRKGLPFSRRPIVNVREAVPDTEPADGQEPSLSEDTPVEITSQECRLGLSERTIIEEFLDTATPPERKEEIAERLREAGFEIRSRKRREEENIRQQNETVPARSAGIPEGENVSSLQGDGGQDHMNEEPAVPGEEDGENRFSMDPCTATVNLDEFGVIDQDGEITAGMRS